MRSKFLNLLLDSKHLSPSKFIERTEVFVDMNIQYMMSVPVLLFSDLITHCPLASLF